MNKEKLISYLYQEMHASERRSLETNQEMMKEARELAEVRAFLQSDEDESGGNTPIFIKPKRRINLSKWWALAASLVILLVAGKLLDVRFEKKGNQLTLSYGELPEADIDLQSQFKETLVSLVNRQRDLNDRIDGLQNIANKNTQTTNETNDYRMSPASLRHLLEKENSLFAEQLTQQLQQDQQAYTLEVVNTLLDFWDGQRKQDLQVVNNGLQNLAQTIQLNSDEFAQFTNQSVQNY